MINHNNTLGVTEPKAGDIVFYIYERGNPGIITNVDVAQGHTRTFYTLDVEWLCNGRTNVLSDDMLENADLVVAQMQAEKKDDIAKRYSDSIQLLRERYSK